MKTPRGISSPVTKCEQPAIKSHGRNSVEAVPQASSTQRQFYLLFPFLQTNITSQMWPSGGKGQSYQAS